MNRQKLNASNYKIKKKILNSIASCNEEVAKIQIDVLSSLEPYKKESYFTLLSSIAFIDGDINTEERIFLSALIKGSKFNCDISKIIDKSLTIEKEIIVEFVTHFGKDKRKYNFILHSLMMARIDGKINDQEAAIISELSEILDITKEEILFISELALAIMEKNVERVHNSIPLKPDNIDFIQFDDHLRSFIIILNDNYDYELSNNKLNGNIIIESPITYNKNITIDNANLYFTSKGKITFENNTAIKIIKIEANNSEFIFNKCKEIIISDCIFKNNKNKRPLTYENCYGGVIETSEFENCDLFSDKRCDEVNKTKASGAAIYLNITDIELHNLKFNRCIANNNGGAVYIYNKYKAKSSYLSFDKFNEKIKVINLSTCSFINCTSVNGNGGGLFIYAVNTSEHGGMGAYSLYHVNNSNFENCSAINGGGLWIYQPNESCSEIREYDQIGQKITVIYNSKFKNCRANEYGGGLWIAFAKYTEWVSNSGNAYYYYCYSANTKFIDSDVYIDDIGNYEKHYSKVLRYGNTYHNSKFQYKQNDGTILNKSLKESLI